MRLTPLRLKLATLALTTLVMALVLLIPHPATDELKLAISHVWCICVGHAMSDMKGGTE